VGQAAYDAARSIRDRSIGVGKHDDYIARAQKSAARNQVARSKTSEDRDYQKERGLSVMWKLFAMVLVVSDTGSVATSQVATDFATPQACEQAARQLFPRAVDRDVNGHRLSIRASAECRPDGPMPPPIGIPLIGR
jgi:hypothetical protein